MSLLSTRPLHADHVRVAHTHHADACERCDRVLDRVFFTSYADELLCPACLVRVRDMTCRYCGGTKPADPMRELCDPCVLDGFGYR